MFQVGWAKAVRDIGKEFDTPRRCPPFGGYWNIEWWVNFVVIMCQ